MDETITHKDLYKELWHCRDFELSHLWQRSVFLATFLLAIAGGYGTYVTKIIFPDVQKECSCQYKNNQVDESQKNNEAEEMQKKSKSYQHFIAVGLCYLGICFSILWIMMAKGSKYWYESYEQSINDYIGRAKKDKIWIIKDGYPIHGDLDEPYKMNSSIFSFKAYEFSVSGVNCCIGLVFFLCWLLLSIIHMEKAIFLFWDCEKVGIATLLLSIGFSFSITGVIYALLFLLCKSGD